MPKLCPKPGIQQIKPHMLAENLVAGPPVSIVLNANENAYGPSPNAVVAAKAAITGIERYFENPLSIMRPALARRFDLDEQRIAIGHGSDDLLSRLARVYLDPGTEMIRSVNGYLKTPNYAFANGAQPISAPDDNFTASTDAILECVTDRTRIVYLANPDNPAGTYLKGSEIRRLHAGLPEKVILILDCAYEEYVDAADYEPGKILAGEADNVVMTRTFSKIFGLAGARVGWMYGSQEIVDTIGRIGLTFPLTSPSIAAAIAALEDTAHTRHIFNLNKDLRTSFSQALTALGLTVYPSQANFILVEFPDPDRCAAKATQMLRQKGVTVRQFPSPAYKNCIRITLGLKQELRFAEKVISDFIKGNG